MHDGVGAIVDCFGGLLDEDNLLYKGFKRNMKMEKIITIDLLLPDFQNIDPDDEERINERKKLIE